MRSVQGGLIFVIHAEHVHRVWTHLSNKQIPSRAASLNTLGSFLVERTPSVVLSLRFGSYAQASVRRASGLVLVGNKEYMIRGFS